MYSLSLHYYFNYSHWTTRAMKSKFKCKCTQLVGLHWLVLTFCHLADIFNRVCFLTRLCSEALHKQLFRPWKGYTNTGGPKMVNQLLFTVPLSYVVFPYYNDGNIAHTVLHNLICLAYSCRISSYFVSYYWK